MNPFVKDTAGDYETTRPISENELFELRRQQFERGTAISSPGDSRALFVEKLAHQEREVFALLLLDNRHRVIEYRELFFGTIDGASVYPREVVTSWR